MYNIELEKFDYFKELGSDVNKDTAIEQQVKRRIVAGNKVFYANTKMIFIKLLIRRFEMRIYTSLIRPVVRYGWVLKDKVDKHSDCLIRKYWGRYTAL